MMKTVQNIVFALNNEYHRIINSNGNYDENAFKSLIRRLYDGGFTFTQSLPSAQLKFELDDFENRLFTKITSLRVEYVFISHNYEWMTDYLACILEMENALMREIYSGFMEKGEMDFSYFWLGDGNTICFMPTGHMIDFMIYTEPLS